MILSSKPQFIPKYLDGTKIHSIRKGKRWKAGMRIQYYQDTRTKNMRKFMGDGLCTSVQNITMTRLSPTHLSVFIDDYLLGHEDIKTLARNDGFDNVEDFVLFFFPEGYYGMFEGQIIHWTDFKYL